ncbi:AbrB/MazE/SpoVT family DNA-binding domain-containing protein [Halopenitus sp. H-Gu1]|uniref:AbrB/MazE/SpoVT family DNA-binding domain-containing protein n=1 Tax=Halopenitus sp. H-Gu1 TaxID=3242697 RepID=UPI00359D6FB7
MTETRTLQQVKGGTYTVSIPREWAEARGVEAGEPIAFHRRPDGSLLVRSTDPADRPLAFTRIVVAGADESDDDSDGTDDIVRRLRSAYVAGYERIVVEPPPGDGTKGTTSTASISDGTRRAVRSMARGSIGITLDIEADDRIVLREVTDAGTAPFAEWIRRLRRLSASTQAEAVESILDGVSEPSAPPSLDHVASNREDRTRLVDAITRYVTRALADPDVFDRLGFDCRRLVGYALIAHELDRIADDVVALHHGCAHVDLGTCSPSESFVETADRLTEDAHHALERAVIAVTGSIDANTSTPSHGRSDHAIAAIETRDRVLDRVGALRDALRSGSSTRSDYRATCALGVLVKTVECAARIATLGIHDRESDV